MRWAAQGLRGSPRLWRGQPAGRPALGPLAAGRTMAVVARVTSMAARAGGQNRGLRQPAGHLGADGACNTPSVPCWTGDGGVYLPKTPLVTQRGREPRAIIDVNTRHVGHRAARIIKWADKLMAPMSVNGLPIASVNNETMGAEIA